MKRKNLLLGSGIVLVCAAIAAIALAATRSSSVPFAEVSRRAPDERLQVYGKLDPRSVRSIRGANLVRFVLVEEKTERRLEVLYDRPDVGLPANFPNASHASVSGYYDPAQNRLRAENVLTKCPSKYDKGGTDIVRKSETARWLKESGLKPAANEAP